MRAHLATVLLFGTLAASCGTAARAEVGVTTMTVGAPDAGRVLAVTLWYPAEPGGSAVRLGDGPVFQGVAGRQDAPVAAGALPLVLVAHGGLRSAPGQGNWLGARLAARGFVAALVQGPRLGPGDAAAAVEAIGRRAADLDAALSALENDPAWAGRIDHARIGAVGFFLGGTSALALAGAQLDAERFTTSCDPGGTGVDCAWLAASGVDLHGVDTTILTRPHRDPRIKAVVAVAPELATSFAPTSLAGITVPVDLVDLGHADSIPPGLRAAELGAAIPGARYRAIPDATPFSAFASCKPEGAAILEEEGESGAICRESSGRERDAIHAELAASIADGLAEHLHVAPGPTR